MFCRFGCVSKKVSGCWFLVISSHQQQQSKVDFYWDFRRDVPAPGEPLVLKPSLQAACRDLLSPFHSQISVWEPSAWEPLLWNLLKECVVFCCFIWWYVFCECVEHVVTALLVRWHLGHNVFGIVFQKSDLVNVVFGKLMFVTAGNLGTRCLLSRQACCGRRKSHVPDTSIDFGGQYWYWISPCIRTKECRAKTKKNKKKKSTTHTHTPKETNLELLFLD